MTKTPPLLFSERPRLGLHERANVKQGLPTQFISEIDGDVGLGLSFGGLNSHCSGRVAVNDNFVVTSWGDRGQHFEVQDRSRIQLAIYLAAVLGTVYSVLIVTGAITDASQVDPQPSRGGPALPVEYNSSHHRVPRGFVLSTLLINGLAVASAYDCSPGALTVLGVFVYINFFVTAPHQPSFLFILRYANDIVLSYLAFKLRSKLVVCWVASGNAQR
mmetsp:Transcript_19281/g.32682  ORF Transcript_19281/g.32682 Transcript_19281/m.32682 type:complete len:217 (+) Transcript_19281:114-764(+)